MRHSDLTELMRAEFGPGQADLIARDHVLTALQGRTPEQALAHGIPVKAVWAALCEEFDVPPERRFGRDPKPTR